MTIVNFNVGDRDLLYSCEDNKRLNDLFTLQKFLMAGMGQMPQRLEKYFPNFPCSFGKYLARFYSAFVIVNSFSFMILHIKTTYDKIVERDLEGISDAFTMLMIYSISCFTTSYILWRFETLSEILFTFNKYYRHHSMAGLTYLTFYKPYKAARRLNAYWVFSCFIGVSTWGLAPILLQTRTLPLKCWYPFDVMRPIVYEINYVLQFFGQINVGTTFSICSGLYSFLVILVLTQFDILYCSLKNLNFHARLLCGEDLKELKKIQQEIPFQENDELNQYLFLEEHKTDLQVYHDFYAQRQGRFHSLTNALHESVVECVHFHRFILKICADLENFYNPFNLIISLQVTVQLCLLVFAAVTGERSVLRVINQIQYFCLTLANLFIFTYSGELLRQHSVRSGQAFWRSYWSPFDLNPIRKDILIFLMNSNRVVQVTAGKFYYMDIARLRTALTQAFSFFTLLRKIAAKND